MVEVEVGGGQRSAAGMRGCSDTHRVGRPALSVRVVQLVRRLLKATVWDLLTAALDRVGLTLRTVQVLCVDCSAGMVLLMRTGEYRSGFSPVQGLRKGSGLGLPIRRMGADVRADARRELGEEAVLDPPPIECFRVADRYREGPLRQFDCTVLAVDCQVDVLRLRPESGEGAACWMPLDDARRVLPSRVLRDLLADLAGTPFGHWGADRRRFLVSSTAPGEARADIRGTRDGRPKTPAMPACPPSWDMALSMLRRAREQGGRSCAGDPQQAQLFWEHLAPAQRRFFESDAPAWRDCGQIAAARLPDLLALWPNAALSAICRRGCRGEVTTIAGRIDPAAALRLQARTDAELSLDLIYDASGDRLACCTTRGAPGMATSNLMLYALLSQRYTAIPVFHTHPGFRSDLGYKMPSLADIRFMGAIRRALGGAPVGDCVYFPDGGWTEYGVGAAGSAFFRRCADPLLPPGGEPLTTLLAIDPEGAGPVSGNP